MADPIAKGEASGRDPFDARRVETRRRDAGSYPEASGGARLAGSPYCLRVRSSQAFEGAAVDASSGEGSKVDERDLEAYP
jgi:hypothetical protein